MALRQFKLIALGLAAVWLVGAAPSRTQTYVAGNVIEPDEVSENEDNIFTYLQAGVDTYKAGSVDAAAIGTGAVENAELGTDAVTTGKVLDNTLTPADFAATLTFSDGDLIDLSAMNQSAAAEGLYLPQALDCSLGIGEGTLCWDTNGDFLSVGTGATAKAIGTGGTPALTLTTANAAGTATTFIRTDDSILAFDATAPSTQAFGDAAAAGAATVAARRDHKHAMPTPNFENGRVSSTINCAGDSDSGDVSITLDVQSYVIVLVDGLFTVAGAGSPCTYSIRRDTTAKESTPSVQAVVDQGVSLSWSETLAAGAYNFDLGVHRDGGAGVSTLDFQVQVIAIPAS